VRTRREAKAKKRRRTLAYCLVAVAAAALFLGLLVYSFLPQKSATNSDGSEQQPAAAPQKIALVDQLSVQWPDPMFDQTAQAILNKTGFQVDYYPGKDVTVDFYRTLPSHNYKLIVFRVHSTGDTAVQGEPPWVVFFTSENYSKTAYVQEQTDMRLVYVKFLDSDQRYFGISPAFVVLSMEGTFNNTMIIAMGCEGLKYDSMAMAFIEKGAKDFISWNGTVSESHTDNATLFLLRHLVTEKKTIGEAVNETMNDVGPDPTYKSILTFYPDNADEFTLLTNTTAATPTIATATVATEDADNKQNKKQF
jgi:hypothetical protein